MATTVEYRVLTSNQVLIEEEYADWSESFYGAVDRDFIITVDCEPAASNTTGAAEILLQINGNDFKAWKVTSGGSRSFAIPGNTFGVGGSNSITISTSAAVHLNLVAVLYRN